MVKKLLLIFCLGLVSCSHTPEQLRVTGPVFGTTYSIIYDSSQNFETAFDSLFFEINRSMSTYIPTSDISKVNQNETLVIHHHFSLINLSLSNLHINYYHHPYNLNQMSEF